MSTRTTERPTTVISVRGRNRLELEADPAFVYVGRWCAGWRGSIWGNPFKRGTTVGEALALIRHWETQGFVDRNLKRDDLSLVGLYREWILANPELRARIPELRGKVLGCWCGAWKPGDRSLACHARVLAELANGTEVPTR